MDYPDYSKEMGEALCTIHDMALAYLAKHSYSSTEADEATKILGDIWHEAAKVYFASLRFKT